MRQPQAAVLGPRDIGEITDVSTLTCRHSSPMEHSERISRGDPELRSLIQRASDGLTRSRARPGEAVALRPGRVGETGPPEGFLAGCVVLIIILLSVLAAQIRAIRSEPAVVLDAARFVHASSRPSSGHFFVAVVSMGPGYVSDAAGARRGMDNARSNALSAARACAATHGEPTHVTIRPEGLTGPSGGLIFALSAVEAFVKQDLTGGRRIAGTGTISADGAVGPIRAIELKAQAAERAGVDLFLAPASQVTEAERAVRTLRIAGVGTLDDAVRLLTGTGCPTTTTDGH